MDDATMDTKLEVRQEAEVDEREHMKLEAHETMEALSLLEQGLATMNNATSITANFCGCILPYPEQEH